MDGSDVEIDNWFLTFKGISKILNKELVVMSLHEISVKRVMSIMVLIYFIRGPHFNYQ